MTLTKSTLGLFLGPLLFIIILGLFIIYIFLMYYVNRGPYQHNLIRIYIVKIKQFYIKHLHHYNTHTLSSNHHPDVNE